jgi:hypothetical protein
MSIEHRCAHGCVKSEIQCQDCKKLRELRIVASRFLAAVEGHNQSPFDLFQVANYGRKKTEFMRAFDIKTVSEMLDGE